MRSSDLFQARKARNLEEEQELPGQGLEAKKEELLPLVLEELPWRMPVEGKLQGAGLLPTRRTEGRNER